MTRHTIGLLLGTEDDWPSAFTEILRRLGPVDGPGGPHAFDVERITIEPFSLSYRPRYDLVIDRLAYWYYVPREWLKKVAMMDQRSTCSTARSRSSRWRSTRPTAR